MSDDWLQATEVREILNRFEEQDWNRHTDDAFETVEGYMEEVVEEGDFMPGSRVHANLDLTVRERLTGNRQQDMTAFLTMGLMLGSALERDIPRDSGREEKWRDGEFVLPDGEEDES